MYVHEVKKVDEFRTSFPITLFNLTDQKFKSSTKDQDRESQKAISIKPLVTVTSLNNPGTFVSRDDPDVGSEKIEM